MKICCNKCKLPLERWNGTKLLVCPDCSIEVYEDE